MELRIRKNPFDFQLNTVLEDNTEPKVPLSPTQEASFLSFVQSDKVYQKYYDEIIILLGTGLRISELCGLTESDIDFEHKLINVDHQLLKISGVGYHVETPKTKSGIRQIPMSTKVYEAFKRVLNDRGRADNFIVGGYSRFLFLNRNGLPKVATTRGLSPLPDQTTIRGLSPLPGVEMTTQGLSPLPIRKFAAALRK